MNLAALISDDRVSLALLAAALFGVTALALFAFERLALRLPIVPMKSSASRPHVAVPISAGIVLAVVTLGAGSLMPAAITPPGWLIAIAVGGGLNTVLGAIDDRFELAPLPRLAIHLMVGWSVLMLHGLPEGQFDFLGWSLSPLLLWFVLPLYIGWWTNLFNFMDGLDGMVATQAVVIALWTSLLVTGPVASEVARFFVCFGAAFAAFLYFNWHPARLLLGDAGSTFGGFVIAMLTLLADRTQVLPLAASLILTAALWVDATFTLARRASMRERLHVAHLDHAYQHAAAAGYSHRTVSGGYGLVTLFWLGPLAGAAARYPEFSLPLLLLAVGPLVWFCFRMKAGIRNSAER